MASNFKTAALLLAASRDEASASSRRQVAFAGHGADSRLCQVRDSLSVTFSHDRLYGLAVKSG